MKRRRKGVCKRKDDEERSLVKTSGEEVVYI